MNMAKLGSSKIVLALIFTVGYFLTSVLALRQDFPTCRSRDNCIRMTLCTSYMNLIKSLKKPLSRSSVQFLRKQECGFDGSYPMVCCFPSADKRQQNNRFALSDDTALRQDFPTCRSRDNCIRMTLCTSYMNLIKSLKKPLSRSSVQFLRKQECGFDGSYPMVCCFPSADKRQQNNRFALSDDTDHSKMADDNVRIQFDEPARPAYRPDFTLSDPNKYKNNENTSTLSIIIENFKRNPVKPVNLNVNRGTTTEKPSTTVKQLRRRAKNYSSLSSQSDRAAELKKKMDSINQAFMLSSIDYFFARSLEERKNNSIS